MRVKVSDEVIRKIRHYFAQDITHVKATEIELDKVACEAVSEERIEDQFDVFKRLTGLSLFEGKRLLEIGSGFGLFLAIARTRYQLEAYGVEPNEGCLSISNKVLQCYGIGKGVVIKAWGEKLPFQDETFNLIYSNNVLEHTQNPKDVILESIRVLKKGGYLQFVVPNYGSFWEGHYGMLWIPYLPKPLAKIYVALMGRDPSKIKDYQFITQSKLEEILKDCKDVQIIDWGFRIWKERIETLSFHRWGYLHRLDKIIRLIHKLGVAKLVTILGKKLKWHTPIIMTLTKTGEVSVRSYSRRNNCQKGFRLLISSLIGLILIILWLTFIDLGKITEYLKRMDLFWLAVASFFYLLTFIFASFRWGAILGSIVKVKWYEVLFAFSAGNLVDFFIPRLGVIGSTLSIKKLKYTPFSSILPTIYIDKFLTLLRIFLPLILLPFLSLNPSAELGRIFIYPFIFLFLGIIILSSLKKTDFFKRFLRYSLFFIPERFQNRMLNFFINVLESISTIVKSPKRLSLSLFFGFTELLFLNLFFLTLFYSFNYYQVSLIMVLFGYTLVNISNILPAPPAQIGSYEVVTFLIFSLLFGLDKDIVSTVTILSHLLITIFILLVGGLSMWFIGIRSIKGVKDV